MFKQKVSILLIISLIMSLFGCSSNSKVSLYDYFNNKVEDPIVIDQLKITLPMSEEDYIRQLGYDYDTIDISGEDFIVWDEYDNYILTPYEHSHWKFATTIENGKIIPVIFKWTDITNIDTNATRISTWSELYPDVDTMHYYYYLTDNEPFYLQGQAYKTKVRLYFLGEKGKQGEEGYKFDNYLYEGLEIPVIYVLASKMWN